MERMGKKRVLCLFLSVPRADVLFVIKTDMIVVHKSCSDFCSLMWFA